MTLAAGFALAWGGVAAYLLYLHVLQRRLRDEVEALRDRLGEEGEA